MDRKSIIVIAVCFLLMLLLQPLSNKLFPPRPLPPEATNAITATQAVTVAGTNLAPAPAATPPTLTAAVAPRPAFLTNAPEQTVVVTNENARYTFTSLGGGLKLVELARYPETVSKRGQQQTPTNGVVTLNTRALVPVLAQLGGESVEGDGIFTLTRTATGVRAEKVLTNGLRVVKEFQLSTNYLVNAAIRLENDSTQPLDLPAQEWAIGTATTMGPEDKGLAVGVMWYDGVRTTDINQYWFDNRSFGCVPGVPRPEYRTGTNSLVWAAMHNQYFTLVAMPKEPTAQLVAWPVMLPTASVETSATGFTNAPPKGVQTALVYPSVSLAPHAVVERQIPFFAGPKEYRTLARIASRYQNNVDLVMGYGGFIGFFAKALLLAMNWIHDVAWLSYGWAVVAITVIMKLIFWPLTAAGTRSAKRMQLLQPQMNALKAKYKDDPAKMNKKLMEFMKENKVSPVGGCLPMVVQLPVFFGFYRMIQSAIELRGAHFLWVADLAKPDTLYVIPGLGFIPVIGTPDGLPLNLLPIIYIATALWQSHLTPVSPGMDPTQQKMMRWMPLMFLLILYNFSSGLALYMTVQNLLTILQTKLTRMSAGPAPAPASVLTPVQKKKK
jgi:YidC/Oxa1 family membrane protein insertase